MTEESLKGKIRFPLSLSHKRMMAKLRQFMVDMERAEVHVSAMSHTVTNEHREWETETISLTFTRHGTTKSGVADEQFE